MGDRGESGVRCEEEVCTGMEYGMYGVDTRVATVSLHNDQPFFLNLPPLLYIIVIMSCCGSDTGYHCQQLKRANIL